MVGPGGVEPPTSRLSGVRSNHLSYEPILHRRGGLRGAHRQKSDGSKGRKDKSQPFRKRKFLSSGFYRHSRYVDSENADFREP